MSFAHYFPVSLITREAKHDVPQMFLCGLLISLSVETRVPVFALASWFVLVTFLCSLPISCMAWDG